MWQYQYPDELYHWKYIRREYDFNKGCYRYYYGNDNRYKTKYSSMPIGDKIQTGIKDALGYDERKAYNTAKNTVKMEKDYAEFISKKGKELGKEVREDGKVTDIERSWFTGIVDPDLNMARRNLKEARKLADKALKEYEKTPLYKLEKASKAVKRGMDAVANLFKRKK